MGVNAVKNAYEQIAEAEAHYRQVLRHALANGTTQAEISRELGVTREKLRLDAMPEAERQAIRDADAARRATARKAQKE